MRNFVVNEIFYEVFENLPRQGPGTTEATQKAFNLTNLDANRIQVLDIGCGTGASTITLAKLINGQIIAMDNHQPYLDELAEKARKAFLSDKILYKNTDMANLVFKENQFDLIWAEGSIYIIGFANGLQKIKFFLKPNGYAVFSDMNWFKDIPPPELVQFFANECPDMISVKKNLKLIKNKGYQVIHYFKLDESAFWDPYYKPLENRLSIMREKYADNKDALNVIKEVQFEIDLYRKYSDYYGYTFYIMKNSK